MFDANQYLFGVKRLGNEIAASGFKSLHHIVGIAERGNEQERNFADALDFRLAASGFVTVHFGHHNVEEHEVGVLLLHNL